MTWTADYANDPLNNYEVVVELTGPEGTVARLLTEKSGQEFFEVYKGPKIPARWLAEILQRYIAENATRTKEPDER